MARGCESGARRAPAARVRAHAARSTAASSSSASSGARCPAAGRPRCSPAARAPARSGSGRAARAWGSPARPHRRRPAATQSRSCRCGMEGGTHRKKGDELHPTACVRMLSPRLLRWLRHSRRAAAGGPSAWSGSAVARRRRGTAAAAAPQRTERRTAGSRWRGPAGPQWRSPSPCGRSAHHGGSESCERGRSKAAGRRSAAAAASGGGERHSTPERGAALDYARAAPSSCQPSGAALEAVAGSPMAWARHRRLPTARSNRLHLLVAAEP